MSEYLETAKIALRITTTLTDAEIEDLIASAEQDIRASGIIKENLEDHSTYKTAVITYVKANYGLNNEESERLNLLYEKQIAKLALAQETI